MIYGSSAKQTLSLRKKSRGQLLTYTDDENLQYMPLTNTSNACQSGATCYKAGDIRVNAQPHLTAMHTLWVREHNRIAGQLALINPHWDDERIFQEARKITIASIQHITYNEWLPALLGKKFTKKNDLELLSKGYSDSYDETAEPTVSNSFATAILPFANSMFNETLRFVYYFVGSQCSVMEVFFFFSLYSENRMTNKSLSLKEHYNQPSNLQMNYMDHLVRGLSMQNTQKIDMLFTRTVCLYRYFIP